jgi:hypothetical protein
VELHCDLCGKPYEHPKPDGFRWQPTSLKGICPDCGKQLGGGGFSARIVKQEAKKIAKERG